MLLLLPLILPVMPSLFAAPTLGRLVPPEMLLLDASECPSANRNREATTPQRLFDHAILDPTIFGPDLDAIARAHRHDALGLDFRAMDGAAPTRSPTWRPHPHRVSKRFS